MVSTTVGKYVLIVLLCYFKLSLLPTLFDRGRRHLRVRKLAVQATCSPVCGTIPSNRVAVVLLLPLYPPSLLHVSQCTSNPQATRCLSHHGIAALDRIRPGKGLPCAHDARSQPYPCAAAAYPHHAPPASHRPSRALCVSQPKVASIRTPYSCPIPPGLTPMSRHHARTSPILHPRTRAHVRDHLLTHIGCMPARTLRSRRRACARRSCPPPCSAPLRAPAPPRARAHAPADSAHARCPTVQCARACKHPAPPRDTRPGSCPVHSRALLGAAPHHVTAHARCPGDPCSDEHGHAGGCGPTEQRRFASVHITAASPPPPSLSIAGLLGPPLCLAPVSACRGAGDVIHIRHRLAAAALLQPTPSCASAVRHVLLRMSPPGSDASPGRLAHALLWIKSI
ncbi:hypothetical protein BC834DRAFT_861375 [Gloeopeniophorella convolvens]|nr:hypothetical protein BC834DRAFT_861375 [Gloeopeniophorella convolvens]